MKTDTQKTSPVTAPAIRSHKRAEAKTTLSMLTAYDFATARLFDEAGIEMLLVGDSVGMVVYGEPNTLSVTLEQIIMHSKAVARGAKRSLVVADLPFMTYQVSPQQALENAGRLIKEGQAHAVKLEGGVEMAETVEHIVRAGIPVCGHIGLTPQSIHQIGKYRIHGRNIDEREYLIESANALAKAGAFAVVLECIEESLSTEITQSCPIPTIGIGSGEGCDGQVLVWQDLLGLTLGKVPSFVKPEANLKEVVLEAARRFKRRHQLE